MAEAGSRETTNLRLYIIIVSAILFSGLLLELTIGAFPFALLKYPVSLVVGIAILALLFAGRSKLILLLSRLHLTVVLLIVIGLMSIAAGLIPNNNIVASWSFVLSYLLTIVNLVSIIAVRLKSVKKRDITFLIVHFGTLSLLLTMGLGFADKEKYLMRVFYGDPEWRAENKNSGQVVELDIALGLSDFRIDEYPPVVHVINKTSGKFIISGSENRCELIEKQKLILADYVVITDSIISRKMISTKAYLTLLKNGQSLGQFMISCGNYFESPKTIELSDSSVLVMDMPQAKSYISDIVVFRKDKETIKGSTSVNDPLSVGFWTIYQSGYDEVKGKDSDYSVFELVYDPWKNGVIGSVLILFLGCVLLIVGGRKNG